VKWRLRRSWFEGDLGTKIIRHKPIIISVTRYECKWGTVWERSIVEKGTENGRDIED
jgi:hypothetical protein